MKLQDQKNIEDLVKSRHCVTARDRKWKFMGDIIYVDPDG